MSIPEQHSYLFPSKGNYGVTESTSSSSSLIPSGQRQILDSVTGETYPENQKLPIGYWFKEAGGFYALVKGEVFDLKSDDGRNKYIHLAAKSGFKPGVTLINLHRFKKYHHIE